MKFLILRKLKMLELSTADLNVMFRLSDYSEFWALKTSELHQLLNRPNLKLIIMWMCVKELLIRHQFNMDDWEVLKRGRIDLSNDVDDNPYERSELEQFWDDRGQFRASDRVIPGMDLTEEDIRRIFETLVSSPYDDIDHDDLWASYVVNDRIFVDPLDDVENFHRALKFGDRFPIRYFDRNNDTADEPAYLANVNSTMAKIVYDEIYTDPDRFKAVSKFLEPRARLIFDTHQGMKVKDLPRGLKREPPTIPSLKELSKVYVHPKLIVNQQKFVHDL